VSSFPALNSPSSAAAPAAVRDFALSDVVAGDDTAPTDIDATAAVAAAAAAADEDDNDGHKVVPGGGVAVGVMIS